jgi:hypothetical protein
MYSAFISVFAAADRAAEGELAVTQSRLASVATTVSKVVGPAFASLVRTHLSEPLCGLISR